MSNHKLMDKYNPKEFEENLYNEWEKKGYFKPSMDKRKESFCIVMPPPNVTGKLHMGHALDGTMQDMLIRYKRMCGYNTLWVPGTDHAAIATEVKVVEKMKKEELSRRDFIKKVMTLSAAAALPSCLIGKNIDDRYPTDIKVAETVSEAGKGMDDFVTMNKALQQDGIVTTDQIYRQYRNIMVTEKDGKQKIADPDTFDSDIASDIVTYLLSAADYNEYADMNLTLKDDEILIYSSGKEWKKGDNLNFMGKEYTVAGEAEYSAIRYIIDSTMSIFEREILVFPDDEQICALMAEAGQRVNPDEYEVFIGYQLEKALTAEQMETVRALVELGGLNHEAICFKSEEMSVFYTLYGGIFFVGMFLAALFLMATVMIIYYKQMSEGYEDQKRFRILSNVGLTEKEAKESIRTQVMLLFYLPVAAAIMHMIVASSVVRLFLRMILIVDAFTFNMAIAIVCVIFLVVYTIVYKITSREYYKIVNQKD